jgi:hypothetical protein
VKRDQFAKTLRAFLSGPQPYRHLYLWYGETDDLISLLPAGCAQRLDFFQVTAELDHYPFAQDEAGELLRDALRVQLRDWYAGGAEYHPILVVIGCELLARYRVGLHPFYEVLTDRSMVILVCAAADAAYDPQGRLPGYVHCEPGATLAYLSRLVEDDHVVEAS